MTIKLYEKYLAAAKITPWSGVPVPYHWGGLPKSLSIGWLAYGQMFEEFSGEIANSLNLLNDYAFRLKVWSTLVPPMNDQEKLDATHEFIEPIATLALNLPYIIRSRFIFAIAHLCHQANQSKEGDAWKDDLPLDDELFFVHADKYGTAWRSYRRCKLRLEKLGDKKFQIATLDFRNSYNHRFSPRVVIGITQIVTRRLSSSGVSYTFGGLQPLQLDFVANLLAEQFNRGQAAFEAFQKLVREHEASIASAPW